MASSAASPSCASQRYAAARRAEAMQRQTTPSLVALSASPPPPQSGSAGGGGPAGGTRVICVTRLRAAVRGCCPAHCAPRLRQQFLRVMAPDGSAAVSREPRACAAPGCCRRRRAQRSLGKAAATADVRYASRDAIAAASDVDVPPLQSTPLRHPLWGAVALGRRNRRCALASLLGQALRACGDGAAWLSTKKNTAPPARGACFASRVRHNTSRPETARFLVPASACTRLRASQFPKVSCHDRRSSAHTALCDAAGCMRGAAPRRRLRGTQSIAFVLALLLQSARAWPLFFNGSGTTQLSSAFGGDVLLSPSTGAGQAFASGRARAA